MEGERTLGHVLGTPYKGCPYPVSACLLAAYDVRQPSPILPWTLLTTTIRAPVLWDADESWGGGRSEETGAMTPHQGHRP